MTRGQQTAVPPPQLSADARGWYALYTRPHFEKTVHRSLQEMGLHSYLPLRSVFRQWSDRRKLIEEPLFSCYVLVRVNAKERLISLTPSGVVRMLSNAGRPSQIPETEIDAIRSTVESGLDPEPVPNVVPGDLLEVIAGPLTGLQGVLHEIHGKQRFVIAFDTIGQSVAVNIDANCVRKAASRNYHPGRAPRAAIQPAMACH